MRGKDICLKMRLHWLMLLVLSDAFFAFLVWLANPNGLKSLSVIIVLYTVLAAAAGCAIDFVRVRAQLKALEDCLERQGEYEERELMAVTDKVWHPAVREAFSLLWEERAQNSERQQELMSYQEFIEAWTHEIKTPLSLSELVLENHREEMSEYVYRRMRHVQRIAGMDVERILSYARLHAEHVDYQFERIFLPECVKEVLDRFPGILQERGIEVKDKTAPVWIVSDRRVLGFMLSQIFSNAFKYAGKSGGIVEIEAWKCEEDAEKGSRKGDGKVRLAVRDNGGGAPLEDIPFLFDKGFTGSHPGRQNATGMGLYFVKKYAKVLAVDVRVEEELVSGGWFGIEIVFPDV